METPMFLILIGLKNEYLLELKNNGIRNNSHQLLSANVSTGQNNLS